MARLTGKVAIVTGAANGIGRAIAIRLADEGAKVALADIQLDSAEQAAADIRRAGASAIAVALDVTKLDEAIAAADRVESELGPIDILVNNAEGRRAAVRRPLPIFGQSDGDDACCRSVESSLPIFGIK